MNNLLKLVKEMHLQFGINAEVKGFSDYEKKFRYVCMCEEIDEYQQADVPEKELDALVDLIIFALGTVERHGWLDIFEEAFVRVMNANLKKELSPNKKRGSFCMDLKKPEGWRDVDLFDLLPNKED